ncbi:hypothetical protein Goari_019284, partial [Gossypium aridum]|nr:hypothetical protein [Gossypium aridum]
MVAWMTILNKLPTKDGLLAWGWTVDDRGCNGLAPNLKVKHSYFLAILLRLAWSTYIHSIWRERNQRQFGSEQRSKDALLDEIKKVIRLRLTG